MGKGGIGFVSKSELGAKLPVSRAKGRPLSAKITTQTHDKPEATRKPRCCLKPTITLNVYSLFQATMKTKRPSLRVSTSAAATGIYSDQDLIYIAKAKTVEALFRAIQGKITMQGGSSPVLSKSRPESRLRTERTYEAGEKQRDRSLGSLISTLIHTERSGNKLEKQAIRNYSPTYVAHRLETSPSRPYKYLEVVGLASAGGIPRTSAIPIHAVPPQSYVDPSSSHSPATVPSHSSYQPSPPHTGWRPLHSRTLHLSPKRSQRTPVLKRLSGAS